MTRAGGKLLDRSKYIPNSTVTDVMKEMIRTFTMSCTDKAWEAEFYPFGDIFIIRWATNQEISIVHLRDLVNFYSKNEIFKERIVEIHTGAHCTSKGVIGTSEPKFSLADV